MSDNLSGWRKCVTRGMVGCKDCGKTISIMTENMNHDAKALVIRETTREERTYFQKGKKRLCRGCYEKLFKTEHLGNWIDEGDKV